MHDTVTNPTLQALAIARDLEPEEAMHIARQILHGLPGVVFKIWDADDVSTVLDEYHYEANLTDEQRSGIIADVLASYEWKSLSDARNEEWEDIQTAVQVSMQNRGIDF